MFGCLVILLFQTTRLLFSHAALGELGIDPNAVEPATGMTALMKKLAEKVVTHPRAQEAVRRATRRGFAASSSATSSETSGDPSPDGRFKSSVQVPSSPSSSSSPLSSVNGDVDLARDAAPVELPDGLVTSATAKTDARVEIGSSVSPTAPAPPSGPLSKVRNFVGRKKNRKVVGRKKIGSKLTSTPASKSAEPVVVPSRAPTAATTPARRPVPVSEQTRVCIAPTPAIPSESPARSREGRLGEPPRGLFMPVDRTAVL